MTKTNGKNGTALAPLPDGRNGKGQFVPGNPGGPGNPHGKALAKFRSMFLDAVTNEEFEEIREALVIAAKAGKPWAVKEYLDRLLGQAKQAIEFKGTIEEDEVRNRLLDHLIQGNRN